MSVVWGCFVVWRVFWGFFGVASAAEWLLVCLECGRRELPGVFRGSSGVWRCFLVCFAVVRFLVCLRGGAGASLVDAGDEFGCRLDVFRVLVAVLFDKHLFFVSYPLVEEGYPCEG